MLTIKEFEKAMKPVTEAEVMKKRARGIWVPYIQSILNRAKTLPTGKSVEVDIADPKKAFALAQATRVYMKKMNIEGYAAGRYKTFVFCGKCVNGDK